ncbi:riboflavin synthase [Syntrophotalea carbinolica DSM 2380]|uniref:Riboflavin synthase n=1 Tax=Syntrophotalea carbinolica (strain DSM 2380 / NBRC 103641 / GraBd1) TaxID=338963 RepID=Q3A4L5_SYNC1|nr:riboflavin synthase [Syntrophotalea carbinolica]ABA88692.1 riboflavin synthase [Syntrophotalea carbinolica DSM 2380]
MFTGLIEDLGVLKRFQKTAQSGKITVATAIPMAEIVMGESIAVNGVCLTVTDFGNGTFTADVSPESLSRTNLGQLQAGSRVNLERALKLSDRLGGHIVSGHVDALGLVTKRFQDQNAVRFTIEVAESQMRLLVEKGSVTVDGISLTVNSVAERSFGIAVIPHSLSKTTLQWCEPGTQVNIETDILGKYVERLLRPAATDTEQGSISLDFLAKNGFL